MRREKEVTVRIRRKSQEEAVADREFWQELTATERLEETWRLSEELWRLRGRCWTVETQANNQTDFLISKALIPHATPP